MCQKYDIYYFIHVSNCLLAILLIFHFKKVVNCWIACILPFIQTVYLFSFLFFFFFILCGRVNLMFFLPKNTIHGRCLICLVLYFIIYLWFSMKPTYIFFMWMIYQWFKKGCHSVSTAYRKALTTIWPPHSDSSFNKWLDTFHPFVLLKQFDQFASIVLFCGQFGFPISIISYNSWIYSLVLNNFIIFLIVGF